jgi:hypothetical protein
MSDTQAAAFPDGDVASHPRGPLLNTDQAARPIMKGTERIRQLAKEGWIVQAGTPSDRRYRLLDVVQGYIRYRDDEDRQANKSAADSRVRDARARDLETRTQQRLGRLVPIELYDEMLDNVCGLVRSEFAGLPAATTRELTQRRVLEREVNARLRRIAEYAMAEAIRLETGRSPADAVRDHGAGSVGSGEPDVSTNGGGAGPA